MKVVVEVPLQATREYLDDFIPETIPNVGDIYDEDYVVKKKTINGDICTLKVLQKWLYNQMMESKKKGCDNNE